VAGEQRRSGFAVSLQPEVFVLFLGRIVLPAATAFPAEPELEEDEELEEEPSNHAATPPS